MKPCFFIHHFFFEAPWHPDKRRFTVDHATHLNREAYGCHCFCLDEDYEEDDRVFTDSTTQDCLKNDDDLLPALRRAIIRDLSPTHSTHPRFQAESKIFEPLIFSARLSVESPNTDLVPLTAASFAAALSDVTDSFRHGFNHSPVTIYIHTEHLRRRCLDKPVSCLTDFYTGKPTVVLPSYTHMSDRKINYFNQNPSPPIIPSLSSPTLISSFSPRQPEPPLDPAASPPPATPRQSEPSSDPAALAPLVSSILFSAPPILFKTDISPVSNHGRVSPSSLFSPADNIRSCSAVPLVNSLPDDDPRIATNTRSGSAVPLVNSLADDDPTICVPITSATAFHSPSSNSSTATPISAVPSFLSPDPSDTPIARSIHSLCTTADNDSTGASFVPYNGPTLYHHAADLPTLSPPPDDSSSSSSDPTTTESSDASYYDGDPFYQHTDAPSSDESSQRAYIDKSYYDDANDRRLDPHTLQHDTDFDYYYDNNDNCYLYDETTECFTDSYGNSYC